jgi:hypothetical protein
MNATVKIVRISEKLLLEILRHGMAGCKAVVGIPENSFIVAAEFNRKTFCLELQVASNDWTNADDVEFTPVFRKEPN